MIEKMSKNLQLNFLITIVTGILNFTVNKCFLKYLGIEMLGLMKLFTNLIAYLSLVDLGISNASAYALYKPLADKNLEKINKVVSTIEVFYKKISIFIVLIGIIGGCFIQFFMDSKFSPKIVYLYWILYVLNTALGYSFAKYSILFTANQEYGFVRKVQGTGKIIFQSFQMLFLAIFQSYFIFIIILIFENLFNYCFYLKHYKKKYNYIKKVSERDKTIARDMKNLFWHKIATLVIHNTDYIILSKFINLSIVGIYSNYLIICQMFSTLINIITSVLGPKIGLYVAKNSKENIFKYWKRLYIIYAGLSTIFVGCSIYLIQDFVKLWIGGDFLLSKFTIILILINLFIQLIRGVTDTFKNSCGFFNDTYVPFLESLINLIFSLWLVKIYGLDGVIIGTIISNISIIMLLKPILVFKKCFDKQSKDYIKEFLKVLGAVLISLLFSNKVIKYFKICLIPVETWTDLFFRAIQVGSIVGGITFIIFISYKDLRIEFLKVIRKQANHKKVSME
jgi:O-antigen/teichoic acid export membrane protein